MSDKKLKKAMETEQAVAEQAAEEKSVKQLNPEMEQPQDQAPPTHFSITMIGVNELAEAINDTVKSVHVKNVLFNVINTHLKPL